MDLYSFFLLLDLQFQSFPLMHCEPMGHNRILLANYEGESLSNQPIPFSIDRDTQDFHALFQYMF